jgi:hypothetical protein
VGWEAAGTLAAAVVAAAAFAHSLWQARRAGRERDQAAAAAHELERMRFLLGEKETVAFQAGRIADAPATEVSEEIIQALILAALFEASDRAWLQVYRALDTLQQRQKAIVVAALERYLQVAQKYHDGLDLGSFSKRLGQLHDAVKWTIPDGSVSAQLKQEILMAASRRQRTGAAAAAGAGAREKG